MLFAIVHILLGQVRLVGQNIFGNQTPHGHTLVAQILKQPRPTRNATVGLRVDKHFEFHDAGAFHHDALQQFDEGNGRRQRPARGDEIVNDEDAVSGLNFVALHRETAAVAVLAIVVGARYGVGHFALFAHHNKRLVQGQRNGRAQNKAAGVETVSAV